MTTLPIDKVRFIGDPVVCIVARDRYLAEDAAELVAVDYEPLAPVTSMESALVAGAAPEKLRAAYVQGAARDHELLAGGFF